MSLRCDMCTESDFDTINTEIKRDCYIILECGDNILQECGKPIKKEEQWVVNH